MLAHLFIISQKAAGKDTTVVVLLKLTYEKTKFT